MLAMGITVRGRIERESFLSKKYLSIETFFKQNYWLLSVIHNLGSSKCCYVQSSEICNFVHWKPCISDAILDIVQYFIPDV